jgi:hypothetical protein
MHPKKEIDMHILNGGTRMAVAAAATMALVAACSSDGEPSTGGAGAGGEAPTGAGAGAAGGGAQLDALTVVLTTGGADEVPIDGATCALDAPGGERQEKVTDATGRARFEGVDWSKGTASVTCVDTDAASYLGFGKEHLDDDELWLLVSRPSVAPQTVSLSGTTLNMSDPGNLILVQASDGFDAYQGPGPDYGIQVEAGKPFDLLACEFAGAPNPAPHGFGQDFLAWSVQPSRALRSGATIDVDLGAPVVPARASGTLRLPDDPTSPFTIPTATSRIYVSPTDHRYFSFLVGFATRTSFSPDGSRVVFETESHEGLEAPEGIVTIFALWSSLQPDGAGSYVLVNGYPRDGDLDETFLAPPRVLEPVGIFPHVQGTRVRWDAAAPQATTLQILDGVGTSWWIDWPEGAAASEITIPNLPSTTPVDSLFATASLSGYLYREEGNVVPHLYHRVAYGRPLTLQR